jgi:DNA-binding NarL/FixJ family response regulator
VPNSGVLKGNALVRPVRILLVNEPRLLREMLKRVLERLSVFDVVGEVVDQRQLASMVDRTRPHWAIVSLLPGGGIPEDIRLMSESGAVPCILGLTLDGGIVRACCLGDEKILSDLSLDDLVATLQDPRCLGPEADASLPA